MHNVYPWTVDYIKSAVASPGNQANADNVRAVTLTRTVCWHTVLLEDASVIGNGTTA